MPTLLNKVPTLKDLSLIAQNKKKFPSYIFENSKSGICFFAAAFFGKNDVIYLYEYGIKDVCLVDLDEARLNIMKLIYPKTWSIEVADAFKHAKNVNRLYDLVLCDPWTGGINKVFFDNFDSFINITNKYFISFATIDDLFTKNSIKFNKESLSNFLTDYHNRSIKVKEIIETGGSLHGGSLYIIIEKEEAENVVS